MIFDTGPYAILLFQLVKNWVGGVVLKRGSPGSNLYEMHFSIRGRGSRKNFQDFLLLALENGKLHSRAL
jgi:hypothetical protein